VEQIELAKHERSIITLKGLGTAGYRWSFTVDNPRFALVERLIAGRQPSEEYPPSRSVDEQFVITGQNAGETMVRFSQARPFDQLAPPIATREILVRVRAD
jgi:hypothetical protein